MTDKLVVIINSLKVPKIKKILLYEMKFLIPNYSCLQNPLLWSYCPQIPVLSVLCSQLNLLNTPTPLRTKFLGTPLQVIIVVEKNRGRTAHVHNPRNMGPARVVTHRRRRKPTRKAAAELEISRSSARLVEALRSKAGRLRVRFPMGN